VDIDLVAASRTDKAVLDRLLQLYQYARVAHSAGGA
jgi:hypothetical protein